MSEKELAAYIVQYVDRIESLVKDVSNFLNGDISLGKEKIQLRYKTLKKEIKADSHYVSLLRNQNNQNKIYTTFFISSIAEASAFGFSSTINSKIDFKLYTSLAEASYKLTKYYSYEKWKEIAEK